MTIPNARDMARRQKRWLKVDQKELLAHLSKRYGIIESTIQVGFWST